MENVFTNSSGRFFFWSLQKLWNFHRHRITEPYVLFFSSMIPSNGGSKYGWMTFYWHTNLPRVLPNSFWALLIKLKIFIISNFFSQKWKIIKFHEKSNIFSKVSYSRSLQLQYNTFRTLYCSRDNLHIYTSWRLSGILRFTRICGNQVQHFSSTSQQKYSIFRKIGYSF